MRHYIELLYPDRDSRNSSNLLLALGVVPVSGDIVDAFVRREEAGAFGGDITYDVRKGANSSSLVTIYANPLHKPTIPFGTLAGTSNPAAYPVAVTAGQSIGFYRTTNVSGGAGARPSIVIVIEDGDPAVLGFGVSVVGNLARFLDTSASQIEDAGVLVSIDGTLGSNLDTKLPTEKAVKTYADTKVPSSYLDTDGTLAANSDAKVATQKAVKTYADSLFATNDAMLYKGAINASGNPNYPAADAGHTYRISVAGKIGGGAGVNVEIGDFLTCFVDGSAAGNQATVGANWNIVQANLDGAVIGAASSVSGDIVTFSGASGKLIQDSGKSHSIDGTLASNSDALIPTEKAVKTYADAIATAAAAAYAPKTLVQSSKSADYTLVLGDANSEIFHPSTDNNARTFTIPANGSVAFPIGTIVTFVNRAATSQILAITTDTMYLAGSTTTGSRTLGVNSLVTAHKVEATVWIVSGAGLT